MPSTTTSGARYLLVAVDASTIAPDARHSSTLALAAALAAPADEIHLLSVLSGGSASSSSPLALLPSPGLSTAGAAEALVEARIRASKEDRIAASSWLHSSRAALVGEFGVEQERVFLHLLNPAAPGSSSSSSSSPSSSSTAAAIVAYAHAKHADVVVLGSRGMGALARAVGSVGFGGGLGANYFFTKYFGIGVDDTISSLNGNGHTYNSLQGDLIGRYPIESLHLAPYALVGGGATWGTKSQGDGNVGVGLDYRFTHSIGIFADSRYLYGNNGLNETLTRAGLRFAF